MKKHLLLLIILVIYNITGFSQEIKQQYPENKEIRPALLIIDIQNEYLPMMDASEREVSMHVINGLIWAFRKYDYPIIRIYHSHPLWGPESGTEPFAYPESVQIRDDDVMIIKNYPSAFTKTDLDKILKEKGCNTLYLCGLSSVMCVLATYYGGIHHGYKTFMVKDAIMSHNRDYTNMAKDITESVSFESLLFYLENLK